MKKIFFLFILFSAVAFGQQNFNIDNRQIYWQKIYDTANNDSNHLANIFSGSGKITIDEKSPTGFSGIVKDFVMDYKGAGSSFMATPGYLNEQNKYSANYTVEIKDNRYRVTVTNIRLKGLDLNYGMIRTDGNENLEEYALTNSRDAFKKRFLGKEAKIVDYSFSQLFDASKFKDQKKSDW
ncbi:hypothetical protein [uncultured Chryseobacterium sp.]|uniref:hypothetical protein n=1 Tax=uncultured Chryseobacterium sp. TaxID=259322 RepID=UPI0025D56254|nr:hypothetical protein [uncultured Chryseobacterium sp.]